MMGKTTKIGVLKESDLKNYFEGEISAQNLIDKIQFKEIERNIPEAPCLPNTPKSAKFACDDGFHDLPDGGFRLTKKHLLRLCNDFLLDKISAWNLEDIAFILNACDGIVWGNNEEERKLVAEIMFHWSSPEINSPLTKDYIKEIIESLAGD